MFADLDFEQKKVVGELLARACWTSGLDGLSRLTFKLSGAALRHGRVCPTTRHVRVVGTNTRPTRLTFHSHLHDPLLCI